MRAARCANAILLLLDATREEPGLVSAILDDASSS
jgi:hypothetical protein